MKRWLAFLVLSALIAGVVLVVEIRNRKLPAGFQFHDRVTVRWSVGRVGALPARDLRELVAVHDVEQAVQKRMVAEVGTFVIRVHRSAPNSVSFDVYTVNDWWCGQVKQALEQECMAQVLRSVPGDSISFTVTSVVTFAEVLRSWLDFLPWFARAKA
jgi:hypothetical protein